jgi:hypothetical protein
VWLPNVTRLVARCPPLGAFFAKYYEPDPKPKDDETGRLTPLKPAKKYRRRPGSVTSRLKIKKAWVTPRGYWTGFHRLLNEAMYDKPGALGLMFLAYFSLPLGCIESFDEKKRSFVMSDMLFTYLEQIRGQKKKEMLVRTRFDTGAIMWQTMKERHVMETKMTNTRAVITAGQVPIIMSSSLIYCSILKRLSKP